MIIINFKNYVSGKRALELAKAIERYLPEAIVAVSAVDIGYISYYTKLKVYAQHVDCVSSPQRSTGFVTVVGVKSYGAIGSLLNHSEHQLDESVLWNTLNDLKEYKLKSVVCAHNLKIAERIIKLKPYAIAFEDLDLIATNKSITSYRTEDLEKFVKMLKAKKILPFCGAGIHSAEDAAKAFELGCKGVLISSAIANVPLKKAEKLLSEISAIRYRKV